MTYTVYVRENSRYQDPQAEYRDSVHATLADAIARCQHIVDADLTREPRMSPAARLEMYRLYGADPHIISDPPQGSILFSAWDYAAQRVSADERTDPPAA